MPDQKNVTDMGGTMRLGNYTCNMPVKSIAFHSYKKKSVDERHRHRYEFNNKYRETFTKHGMEFTGLSPDGRLVEIVEIPKLRHFLAVQFHPEFKSRPTRPHPLFESFVKSAYNRSKQ
jgi:CTP synthase